MVPSFAVAGWLTMVVALAVLGWSAGFVHRRHGGLVLLGLTVLLVLVGGGLTTLWVGLLAGLAIHSSLSWWRAHVPGVVSRALSALWPWLLAGYLAWAVVGNALAASSAGGAVLLRLRTAVTAATPIVLLLTLLSAPAHDSRRPVDARLVQPDDVGHVRRDVNR